MQHPEVAADRGRRPHVPSSKPTMSKSRHVSLPFIRGDRFGRLRDASGNWATAVPRRWRAIYGRANRPSMAFFDPLPRLRTVRRFIRARPVRCQRADMKSADRPAGAWEASRKGRRKRRPSEGPMRNGKAVRPGPHTLFSKSPRQLGRQVAALGPGEPYLGGRGLSFKGRLRFLSKISRRLRRRGAVPVR